MTVQAFYTLVQAIPDRLRDERINVAIILQCPQTGFSGMRVRPHMDRVLNKAFPGIDAETIRLITYGFSKDFKPVLVDSGMPSLFPEDLAKRPSETSFIDRLRSGYGVIRFSDPRPLIVAEDQSLSLKLEQLYEKLVMSQQVRNEISHITKEILEDHFIRELHNKRIPIDVRPPAFTGLVWPNQFDALREKDNRRHVHFISFDLLEFPVSRAKLFLTSVVDLRLAGSAYAEDEFACVVQSPRNRPELRPDFESVVSTFKKEKIVIFENEPAEILRLAAGLEDDNGLRAVDAA